MLIVEDEARLARNIAKALRETASYAVDISTDGEDGRHQALSNPYDLVVLDLMLPKVGGLEILRRPAPSGQPGSGAHPHRQGHHPGHHPGPGRRQRRLHDQAFRHGRVPGPVQGAGAPNLRPPRSGCARRRVGGRLLQPHRDPAGTAHPPATMEYRLLEYLVLRAGQVVSKAEILEHLYDFNAETFSNVIEVHVSALRKKAGHGLAGRPDSNRPRPGIRDPGDAGVKPLSIRLQLSLMMSLLTLVIITVLSVAAYIEFKESLLGNVDATLLAVGEEFEPSSTMRAAQYEAELQAIVGQDRTGHSSECRVWADGDPADLFTTGFVRFPSGPGTPSTPGQSPTQTGRFQSVQHRRRRRTGPGA